MSWFQKLMTGRIRTQGGAKRTVPDGLWTKCAQCEAVLYQPEVERNVGVCPKCGHHGRISARMRLDSFLDADGRQELAAKLQPVDALKFRDSKKYKDRITISQKKTGETDALIAMSGYLNGRAIAACAFEFNFMGGSMGSVVGQRFMAAVDVCLERNMPLICFSSSGGARMQEGLLSLMQMGKTSAGLARMAEAGLP